MLLTRADTEGPVQRERSLDSSGISSTVMWGPDSQISDRVLNGLPGVSPLSSVP